MSEHRGRERLRQVGEDGEPLGRDRDGGLNTLTQLANKFGDRKRIHLDYTYIYRQDKKPPKPEDAIPDTPENKEAREMLRLTATTGLRAPLGKELKIMQCWRCGSYGHRTGDRDCPLFLSGSETVESFHRRHEDPMSEYVHKDSVDDSKDKEQKVEYYKSILAKVEKEKKSKKSKKRKRRSYSSSESSDSSSSESSSESSDSRKEKKDRKKDKKKRKDKKSHKKRRKSDSGKRRKSD